MINEKMGEKFFPLKLMGKTFHPIFDIIMKEPMKEPMLDQKLLIEKILIAQWDLVMLS